MEQSSSIQWMPLGGSMQNVAQDEGEQVGKVVTTSLQVCEKACDAQSNCKSFAFCEDECYLKGKEIAADAPSHHNKYCTTFRREEGDDGDEDSDVYGNAGDEDDGDADGEYDEDEGDASYEGTAGDSCDGNVI